MPYLLDTNILVYAYQNRGGCRQRLDAHVRIERRQPAGYGVHLQPAQAGHVVGDLPLQVGQFHAVVVAHRQRAHPGRGQIHGHWRAQPPGTNNQGVAGQQCGLSGQVELREQQMAAVAQQLLVVHGGWRREKTAL